MQLDLASAVSTIIQSQIPQGKSDKVLSFGFDYRLYDEEYELVEKAGVFFLFKRSGSYMKVIVWVDSDSCLAMTLPVKSKDKIWRMTSYHDSCWRSDGFSIFGELYRKAVKNLGGDFGELNEDISLGSFNILEPDQVANVKYEGHDGEIRRFIDDKFLRKES